MKSIILAVVIVFACTRASQAAQPSFQFCGLTYNEAKGNMHLFERLTQVYLQTSPTYESKLKNVYLLSDKTVAGFYLEKF